MGQQEELSSESTEDEPKMRMNKIDANEEGYWAKPLLEGHPVHMQIDIGSKASILSEKEYRTYLRHLSLRPSDTRFSTYLGEPVPMAGMTDVTVESNNQVRKLPIYVVEGNYPAILGRVWLEKLRLNWQSVKMLSPIATELATILTKHDNIFNNELGSMKDITVKLSIKPNASLLERNTSAICNTFESRQGS